MREHRRDADATVGLKLVGSRGVEAGVGLHLGLDAAAAEVEAGGVGIVDGVGVIAFDPLAAGGGGGAAEGAGVGGTAIFEDEHFGEAGVFFEFAAAFGGEDFVGEVIAFEPLVDVLDFVLLAEADPGAELGIEEEAGVLEAFLQEGIGPGGELDGFAGGHGDRYIRGAACLQMERRAELTSKNTKGTKTHEDF